MNKVKYTKKGERDCGGLENLTHLKNLDKILEKYNNFVEELKSRSTGGYLYKQCRGKKLEGMERYSIRLNQQLRVVYKIEKYYENNKYVCDIITITDIDDHRIEGKKFFSDIDLKATILMQEILIAEDNGDCELINKFTNLIKSAVYWGGCDVGKLNAVINNEGVCIHDRVNNEITYVKIVGDKYYLFTE